MIGFHIEYIISCTLFIFSHFLSSLSFVISCLHSHSSFSVFTLIRHFLSSFSFVISCLLSRSSCPVYCLLCYSLVGYLSVPVSVESQEQYRDNIKWIKAAQDHGLVSDFHTVDSPFSHSAKNRRTDCFLQMWKYS